MARAEGKSIVSDKGTGRLRFPDGGERERSLGRELVEALGGMALTTAIAVALRGVLTTQDLVAMLLLGVVLVSSRCRRGPALLAGLLGIVGFAFYFVPPWYTFAGPERGYVVAYGAMLAIPAVVGGMTARLRALSRDAGEYTRQSRALADASRSLAGAETRQSLAAISGRHIGRLLDGEVTLRLVVHRDGPRPARWLEHNLECPDVWIAAELALRHGEAAGWGTGHLGAAEAMVLPLRSAGGILGAAVVRPEAPWRMLSDSELRTLELLADLIGGTLERILRAEPGDARSARMWTPRRFPDLDEILMSHGRTLTPL